MIKIKEVNLPFGWLEVEISKDFYDTFHLTIEQAKELHSLLGKKLESIK